MSRIATGAAALLMLPVAMAQAGALDRTGQPVTALFEDGNYVELGYAVTMPAVEGTFGGAVESGDVGDEFSTVALSFKYDVTDRISVALIIDQPFGVDVSYEDADAGYPVAGTTAEFNSTGITALGRYKLNESFSVHGGARFVEVDADLFARAFVPALGGFAAYDASYGSDSDVGYVIGAAYERPDIALRVALTYSSETEFQNDVDFSTPLGAGSDTTNEFTLPQSVNLDVRTGIAAGTAIIGSVRWVDWSETEIRSPGYFLDPTGNNTVVSYEGDYYTTTIGVGRQFSDSIRGSASLIYENEIGEDVSNLSPYDGQLGVLLGGTYLVGNGLELTGAVRYALLGDATTEGIGAEFEDNDSLSLGARMAYRF